MPRPSDLLDVPASDLRVVSAPVALTTLRHERRMIDPVERTGARALAAKTLDDRASTYGAALGSLGLTWVLYQEVLPFSGYLGFVLSWYVVFVVLYATVTSLTHPGPAVRDRIATALITGGASVIGLALFSILVFTFYRGWPGLHHLNTYTHDGSGVGPMTPLNQGGVLHAIIGTLIEIGIAVAIALPLGVGTAVYMVEVGGRLSRIIRTITEAMTALPSIVAGLFAYTVFLLSFGFERSGFVASMAITVMITPIIARAADVVLRVVPGSLREASLALGASTWQTVWRVVLPTARPGLATALILGVARGIGETSPVLLTSGPSIFYNYNPLHNPMNSLPLYIFATVRSGQTDFIDRGFACAGVLLIVVLTLFIVARFLARPRAGR